MTPTYLPPLCRMMKTISAATSRMVICTPGRMKTERRLRYSGSRLRRRRWDEYLLDMTTPCGLKFDAALSVNEN